MARSSRPRAKPHVRPRDKSQGVIFQIQINGAEIAEMTVLAVCVLSACAGALRGPILLQRAPLQAPTVQMGVRTWTRGLVSRLRGKSVQIKPIGVGADVPDIETVEVLADTTEQVKTGDLLSKGRNVLVGIPGAFTPTCTDRHLPGFVKNMQRFANLDTGVFFVAANDHYVMRQWNASLAACTNSPTSGVRLLSDGTRGEGPSDASGFASHGLHASCPRRRSRTEPSPWSCGRFWA